MVVLRPYQETDIAKIREAFGKGAKRVLYVLPTGGGKTFSFCYIVQAAQKKETRCGIIAHRQELIRQCSRALEKFQVTHGIIAPGHTPTRDDVQVASVQTLARRLGKVEDFDFGVLDEAHHALAGSWEKVFSAMPNAKWLGVTATPERLDGAGLGKVFDVIIIGPSIKDLIEDGYLCRPLVYAPPMQLSLKGIETRGGDYAKEEVIRRVDRPTITGDAVQHYQRLCAGQPTICFCASIDHAEHVAEKFRLAGFRSRSLDGTMSDSYREETISALGNGGLDILTSCDIISEGTDIPVVGAASLLRPTKSLSLFLQQIGRALRPLYAPGFDLSTREGRLAAIAASPKPHAIILDHVGNTMLHGLPEEDRDWSLAGSKNASGGKKVSAGTLRIKQCPNCYHTHKPALKCPVCGHVYITEGREIKQVKGELVSVEQSAVEYARLSRRLRELCQGVKSVKELKAEAKSKGYKESWAHITFRQRNEEIMEVRREMDKYANVPIVPVLGGQASSSVPEAKPPDIVVPVEGKTGDHEVSTV